MRKHHGRNKCENGASTVQKDFGPHKKIHRIKIKKEGAQRLRKWSNESKENPIPHGNPLLEATQALVVLSNHLTIGC